MIVKYIHRIAATIAMMCIIIFFLSTITSEIMQNYNFISYVKHNIATFGIPLLILSMAATGLTGNLLRKKSKGKIIRLKQKRMKMLCLIGLFIMIPSAFFLDYKARSDDGFDMYFYTVQSIELIFGVVQLWLLGKNFHAGLILSAKHTAGKPL